MAILINRETRVLIQGITGKEGAFHSRVMLKYGTRIVAGVTPGRYGEKVSEVPVYDTVREALEDHAVDASGVFAPAKFAMDAALEGLDAGIRTVVVVTEGIVMHDAMRMMARARENGATLIGPNTRGLVTVGRSKIGILDTHYVIPGSVGVISRGGTLTTEITACLVKEGMGQSSVVGIGGRSGRFNLRGHSAPFRAGP